MTPMRLFIAVNFDERIKKYLQSVQESVRGISRSGNFSHKENLHLTLVFLGETESPRIRQIERAMDEISSLQFQLTLGGIGKFSRRGGDVVWVGVKRNDALADIHNQLCTGLRSSGFELESRDFRPHLTIGRQVKLTEALESVAAPDITTTVSSISLMKSERIDGRLTYGEIHAARLWHIRVGTE